MHPRFRQQELIERLDRIGMRGSDRERARLQIQRAELLVDILMGVVESARSGGRVVRYFLATWRRQSRRTRAPA